MLTDASYRSKKIFEPSNMVVVAHIDQTLNLRNVAETLLLYRPKGMVFDSEEKIPYFNVEKVIVGLTYDDIRRGIRKDGGVANFVSIDLQYQKKNIHVKISKDNFNIMGLLNQEMGREAAKACLDAIIHSTQQFSQFLELPNIVKRETEECLLRNLHKGKYPSSPTSITTLMEECTIECTKSDIYMGDCDEFLSLGLSSQTNTAYYAYLAQFTYDYPSLELMKAKIERLRNISSVYTEVPSLINYNISNGIYNYNLGVRIPMIKTTRKMVQAKYGVQYNNCEHPNIIYVMIPFSILDASIEKDKIMKNKTTIKAHRFEINKCGSIRQTSPCSIEMAMDVRNMLISEILKVFDE